MSDALLHAGPLRWIGKAAGALWLMAGVVALLGVLRVAALWLVAASAGGVAFALLSDGAARMVGASGCVFAVLGAVVMLEYIRTGRTGMALAITARLIVLNVLTLILEDGVLAWQPHMAGYLVGPRVAALR